MFSFLSSFPGFGSEETPEESVPRYFISLGAGPHQLPVIKAAREMGYSVIAVDQNLQAPGFEHADIHMQCSITRPHRIVERIKESFLPGSVSGVGCRSFGKANLSSAVIARRFGTPGVSIESLRLFKNKRRLKERLAEAGLTVPKSYGWRNYYEKVGLRVASLPLIARPATGHGKQGIHLLNKESQLLTFIDNHVDDNNTWLVEEIIKGDEVTVMGFVKSGIFHRVCITDKIVSEHPPLFAEVMHRYPSLISESNKEKIEIAMQKIVTTTGLRHGPIVAEFIVGKGSNDREEKPYIVECAPEIGGEFLADHLVPAAGGKNYFQQIIALLTRNNEINLDALGEGRTVIIRYILQKDGRLLYMRLPESLAEHPGFLFARELKAPADVTSTQNGNLDRLAVFGLTGSIENRFDLESDAEEIVSETIIQYE